MKKNITCSKISILFLSALFSCLGIKGYATTWTTSAAGSIYTLTNWSDGTTSPSSFTTPGDIWNITMPMTMSSGTPWTVGTPSASPVTVTIAPGGYIQGSGGGFQMIMNIYGDMNVADSIIVNGGSCKLLINTYGNFSTTAGAVLTNGGSCNLILNINGNFSMTAGSIIASGGSAIDTVNVKGNFSMSGPSFISGNGGSATSAVFLSLPSASGTMLADNTSTGAWVSTNVYISANCTAQLDGNFSTSTGGGTLGLTVNGTLICPAAYTVNGADKFVLNSAASLEVAQAGGVNGAITNSGIKTFSSGANYVFNGAAAQVTGSYLPASLNAPDTITINNSAGVTLSQTTATTGTLLFNNGILSTTPAFTMSVPGAATAVVGAGASNYVDGTLIKTINGLTTVNYEVGDADYAPMALALAPAGSGGSIGLMATGGLHPSVATSGLSTANMANHYWTITNIGAAGPATVIPQATYNVSDIIGGTNASFVTQEYASAAWLGSSLATTNTSSPYTSAPTIGIALTSVAGDYIFGNVFCGTLPITGTSALCAGATTTLSDATTGGSWSSGATAVATVSAGGIVSGVSGGTATISYTNAGCTVTDVVTINPAPNAGSITGGVHDTLVCVGRTDTLTDAAGGGAWSSNNTALATVSASGIVHGVVAGIDTIVYTVTNSCGTATAKLRVKVLSTAACIADVSPVTEAAVTTELKIFPNPNTGTFTINLLSANNDEVHVIIMNITGQKVKEFTTTANKATDIMLSPVAGIYLVSATVGDSRYFAKVVVE